MGRTTARTFLSNCKVLVILILHQTSMEKPRVRAAGTPASERLLVKQQKRPSPSRSSTEALLLARWRQSGCSIVPGRSQLELQGGHSSHLPCSRPARQDGAWRGWSPH